MLYKFNTYVISEQDEAKLKASNNPFAIAVLAAFYLTEAGTDSQKRFEYKKKLIEIAAKKNFDRKKLSRLVIFVKYLIKLPLNLENDFKDFILHSKKEQKMMKVTKEDLMDYKGIFGDAVAEIREEGEQKGLEKGLTLTVINLRREMGLSIEQIANLTGSTIEFVQSIIDKVEK